MKRTLAMTCVLAFACAWTLAAPSACSDKTADQPLVVVQDGKYGYIDHIGRIVIRPQFIWANDFWRGLATVYVCGHYVSMDPSGAIVPLRVTVPGRLEPRNEGQKVGFVDEHGRFKIDPSFDEALEFSDGLAAVKVGERWGFVDANGKMAIRPQFDAAYYFYEGVASAALDGSDVLIDRSGQVLASGFAVALEGLPAAGRVPASKGDKSGYLDLRGHVAIPLIYDSGNGFSGGLAAVEKAGKWGYIDPTGRVVIPFEFDEAGQFGSGLAPARVGTRTGFINKSGRFAFELAFDYAPGFFSGNWENNRFSADSDVSRFWTTDDKFGIVNTSGRVIWGPTDGSPGHGPLLGWSEEQNAASCQGISESMKATIARLFPK